MREQIDNRDQEVARLAALQWGVLTYEELRRCGLTANAIAARVAKSRLHPVHRGVYAVGHTNLPLEGRFLAAVKACGPTAVLSHHSAAALWGLLAWDDRFPEITVPGTTARCHPRIKAHRSLTLQRNDTTRRRNIPTTTPARTLHDLAAILPYKQLRRASRQALSLRLVAKHHLPPAVAATAAPTRSELEDAVLDLIVQGGLEPPQVNVPLRINGRRIVPDFRWPPQRLVVEADGAEWHDNLIARKDDAERQAILEAYGERVVRVTWDQAIRRRRETLTRLERAGAPRLQSP
jgi:very-short-patch-repair endonuclease